MDIPALTKLLDYGLLGILLVLALYAIVTLYKKVLDVQEKRIQDGVDREKTITIALNTVAQKIEASDNTMKAIMITLEKQHDKN